MKAKMDNIALFDMDRSLVDYDEGIINSLNMIVSHDEKKITKENIGRVKKNAAILHPLPRNEEISEDIDDDHRADYHERQVRNGLYIRTALLNYLLYPTPMHRPSSDGIN